MIFSRRAESIFSLRVATIDFAPLKDVSLFVVSERDIYSRYLDSKSMTMLSELLIYLMSKSYYARMSAQWI